MELRRIGASLMARYPVHSQEQEPAVRSTCKAAVLFKEEIPTLGSRPNGRPATRGNQKSQVAQVACGSTACWIPANDLPVAGHMQLLPLPGIQLFSI